jgi:hypothetical protein
MSANSPRTGPSRGLSVSANNPCLRSVHCHGQSRVSPRPRHVPQQSTSTDRQRSRPIHGHTLASDRNFPGAVRSLEQFLAPFSPWSQLVCQDSARYPRLTRIIPGQASAMGAKTPLAVRRSRMAVVSSRRVLKEDQGLFPCAAALTRRARIQFQSYVPGRRVNVLLASFGCAPH